MSGERYEPSPAPLTTGSLPEYVLRELRRAGGVMATYLHPGSDASISGAWVFLDSLTIAGSAPAIFLTETDRTLSDDRRWQIGVEAGRLFIAALADAGSAREGLSFERGSSGALTGITLGNPTDLVMMRVNGGLRLVHTRTPAALAADQNDYAPTGYETVSQLRASAASADRTITGLAGGVTGRIVVVSNVGTTYSLVLAHESASSSTVNRFVLNDAADWEILPGASVLLYYDGSSSRWRVPATDVGGGAGSGLASLNSVSVELMIDTPLAYWRLNDAAGFADSSSNTYSMSAVGAPSYQYGAWCPRETTKYVWFGAGASLGAAYSGPILTVPANGDWTFETIFVAPDLTSADAIRLFAISTTGETEATNYQVYCYVTTNGVIGIFWEYSAGTNVTVAATVGRAQAGRPQLLSFVKNGSANNVSFFIDGILTDVVSYANEPSGGSSALAAIHFDRGSTAGIPGCGMAHASLYDKVLTSARVRKHAQVMGFLSPEADLA